jgi:hypothetical protein
MKADAKACYENGAKADKAVNKAVLSCAERLMLKAGG